MYTYLDLLVILPNSNLDETLFMSKKVQDYKNDYEIIEYSRITLLFSKRILEIGKEKFSR